jgi:hypothetical protein
MRLRPLSVLLACALLALTAAACKGGGGTTTGGGTPSGTAGAVLTLQEYFQNVQALQSQAAQRFDASQGLLRPNPSADEGVKIAHDAIAVEAAFLKEQRDGLQQLSPPPEVTDAHQEAIDALNAWLEFFQTASDAAATATDLVEWVKVRDSKEALDVGKRLSDSCLALQQAAADLGITIELGCIT